MLGGSDEGVTSPGYRDTLFEFFDEFRPNFARSQPKCFMFVHE